MTECIKHRMDTGRMSSSKNLLVIRDNLLTQVYVDCVCVQPTCRQCIQNKTLTQ